MAELLLNRSKSEGFDKTNIFSGHSYNRSGLSYLCHMDRYKYTFNSLLFLMYLFLSVTLREVLLSELPHIFVYLF